MILFAHIGDAPRPSKPYHDLQLDEDLFRRIGEDDMVAFETLYRQTERSLYAYILSLVKHPDDALDLLQDTYLKVRAAAHLYQPQGKPMAWLFTIAKNLTYSHFRKKPLVGEDALHPLADNIFHSYEMDRDDRLVLESAFQVLRSEEREIIFLYAITGLKHREIAQALDLPLATVLSKYHRALKKLRTHLEKEEHDD